MEKVSWYRGKAWNDHMKGRNQEMISSSTSSTSSTSMTPAAATSGPGDEHQHPPAAAGGNETGEVTIGGPEALIVPPKDVNQQQPAQTGGGRTGGGVPGNIKGKTGPGQPETNRSKEKRQDILSVMFVQRKEGGKLLESLRREE